MTYQYIPNPNEKLSKSQADIKSNFNLLDTTIGTNHFPPTAASNAGKHKFVEMVNRTIPATAASEGSLYTKQATSVSPSEQSQLFYTSDDGAQEYQMTRCIDASMSLFSTFVNNYNGVGAAYTGGWTFLPGGLILQYGFYNAGGGGLGASGTITFPVTYTSNAYLVSPVLIAKVGGTSSSNVSSVISGSINTTQFQWNIAGSTSAYTGIYWTSIGK